MRHIKGLWTGADLYNIHSGFLMASSLSSDSPPSSRKAFVHYAGMKGFLLMEGLLKLVGMKTLFRLGRMAGGAAWHLLPKRRKIVERNLRIVLDPALRGRELKKLGKENFRRTIANFLCSAKTAILTDDQLKKCVKITGHEAFARPVLEGRGQVCAIAHSGNWEALARICVFYPEIERYGSMYRQFDNPLMEEYMYRRRTERGTQMFSKEGGIKAPMKILKEGGALGVLSDQFVWEGVYVPFFGKVTGTTPLPALLRKRAGADMVAIAVRTDKPGHWIADMGNVVDFSGSDGSLAGDTMEVNRHLEELIGKSVLDVFWMHHRWKSIDRFAPRDEKTFRLLEKMELKPYRILVAVPRALDEALLTVPLIRALKGARPDMQVSVICPSDQAGVWKTFEEVAHVLPHDSLKQLREALAADEFYNEGPLDLGVMLDQDMETLKALAPYGPMMFSGLDTHPGCRKYKFRVKASVLKAAPPVHRVRPYLHLGDLHGLDIWNSFVFPVKKAHAGEGAPVLIAPFSTLGPASEWGEEQWEELVRSLPGRPVLVALEEDRARASALAERLQVEMKAGAPEDLFPVMDAAAAAIAVDGVIPSLCSCRGLPTVTLFSTRLPDVCRPLGQFHRSLYSHQCCSPCFLRECDRGTPCNRSISVQEALDALREINAFSS